VRDVALIVLDVQRGFDDAAYWGPRDNPACEANIGRLLAGWEGPRVFVRHDSTEPGSPLRPGQPGHEFKAVVRGEPDLLVAKQVNSGFLGTPDLDAWLRARGIGAIAVCGITTNHCCETTARMGANLGYDVAFVLDATHAFDRAGPDGETYPAALLARVTAANLHGEFARVVATRELV
jgi:nicotinamidase-related amidase